MGELALNWPSAARRAALLTFTIGLTFVVPQAAHAALSASLTFSPPSPLTGETVTFVSTSTGVTEPETWDLDRDGACDDATGRSAQRSFPIAGDYTVELCITDGDVDRTLTRTITVQNRPPVAAFVYAPSSPLVGDTVALTSTSFDADGPIAGLAWDLDNDGAYDDGAGVSVSLPLPIAGTYAVTLLARDRDGATNTASQTVTVASPAPRLLSPFPIVRLVATASRRGTRIRDLTVRGPGWSVVKVRCRGRGCRFRSLTKRAGSPTSKLMHVGRLRKRLLRPGAILEIRVSRPDSIGKYVLFEVRRGKGPRRIDRCVMPGAGQPAPCPSF